MEKISVIIPSYNSAATIEPCISSVIGTGYSPIEIIVVDDMSTDGSCDMVKGLSERYPGTVKLIRRGHNGGPAMARNEGASMAGGEYLFFLDSDTVMLKDTLHNFAGLTKDSDAVTGIYFFEPINSGAVPLYKALLNYYFFSRKGIIKYEVFDASRAGIRAEVFKEMGGFNETLSWGMDYENEEFGYRLQRKYKNILAPSVAVKHVFPDIEKLTRTYFNRVALWMEIFLKRKKFESGGVTSMDTGLSSAALLLAIVLLPLAAAWHIIGYACLVLFLVYIFGYTGFWFFVLRKKPGFLPGAVILNIYFTLVIASGALWGVINTIIGKSRVKEMKGFGS